MDSAPALKQAIRCIRECVQVVAARGVDLKNYRGELLPYKLPAGLAAVFMRRMFRTNQLTRRIMELHANPADLTYVCESVREQARALNVATPLFDRNYQDMLRKLGV